MMEKPLFETVETADTKERKRSERENKTSVL